VSWQPPSRCKRRPGRQPWGRRWPAPDPANRLTGHTPCGRPALARGRAARDRNPAGRRWTGAEGAKPLAAGGSSRLTRSRLQGEGSLRLAHRRVRPAAPSEGARQVVLIRHRLPGLEMGGF